MIRLLRHTPDALGSHLTRGGACAGLVSAGGAVMSSTTVEHTEPEDAVQRTLHQLASRKPDAVGGIRLQNARSSAAGTPCSADPS